MGGDKLSSATVKINLVSILCGSKIWPFKVNYSFSDSLTPEDLPIEDRTPSASALQSAQSYLRKVSFFPDVGPEFPAALRRPLQLVCDFYQRKNISPIDTFIADEIQISCHLFFFDITIN